MHEMTEGWTEEEKVKRDMLWTEFLNARDAARKANSEKNNAEKVYYSFIKEMERKPLCKAELSDQYQVPYYDDKFYCSRKKGHGKNGDYCSQHAKKFPAE